MMSDAERDRRIADLTARVYDLEQEVARLKGEKPTEERTFTASSLPPFVASSDQPAEPIPPRPEIRPGKSADTSIESAIGTRWIGRIGILAILFGVAFFLKYSFDNRLIGETGRVILGIVWGGAFIAAGEYLQKKKNLGLYGQMLSGGGLAVLYLSLYAAFALYHLIPSPLATAGLIAVTTTGMTLSVRYSAFALAAIALLGGFLTPVMLSTGQNQPVTLFSYVLLLDLGTLILLRFRRWTVLAVASLLGTMLLYFAWHGRFYSDDQSGIAFLTIAVFFIFYNLYILLSRSKLQDGELKSDLAIIFGSAAFFLIAFFAQQHGKVNWPFKSMTLFLAAVEIGLAEVVHRRAPSARFSVSCYTAASMILTLIATFAVMEKRWLMPALSAEMIALGWIGLRFRLPELRTGAYLLGVMVLIRFTDDVRFVHYPFESFIPVFNSRFLVCAAAIGGFYTLMALTRRYREDLLPSRFNGLAVLFVLTQVLTITLLSIEVHDFFRFRSPYHLLAWGSEHYAYQLSLSILWALYACLLIGTGILKKLAGARGLGILFLGIAIFKVFLVDLSRLQTFYRIISFIVLGLLLLAVSYSYNRFKNFIFGDDAP